MYLLFVVFCCKKQEPPLGQVTVLRVIWFLLLKANRLSQCLFYLCYPTNFSFRQRLFLIKRFATLGGQAEHLFQAFPVVVDELFLHILQGAVKHIDLRN